jgi:hypothetical protein
MFQVALSNSRIIYSHIRYTGPCILFFSKVILDSFKEERYVQIIYNIKLKCKQNADMSEN